MQAAIFTPNTVAHYKQNAMKRFKKIYVEITNICNLDCSFCAKNSREQQFMSPQNFEIVVAQAAKLTDHIYLHVMGEPLLHGKLDELIGIAKKHGLQVNITTNGVLIDSKLECLVKNPVRKIAFSLHSYAGNNLGISIQEYVLTILNAAQGLKTNTICELRFWDKKEGDSGFSEHNLKIFDIIEKYYELDFKIIERIKSGNLKLMHNLYIGSETQFKWHKACDEVSGVNKFCYGLRNQIGVLVDGTVVPCCLDSEGSINLGNIFSEQLIDIINSPQALEIYNGFSNRTATQKLCQTCTFVNKL